MRPTAVALCVAVSLAGCGPAELDPDLEALRQWRGGVIGGRTDLDDPATVAFGWRHRASGALVLFCTGALVHPRTVLTAAHCFEPAGHTRPDGALEEYYVRFGTDGRDGTPVTAADVRVLEQLPHPLFDPSANIGSYQHDVMVLRLERAVTGVQSLEINPAPLTFLPTRLIGFGYAVSGDNATFGMKRTAPSSIAQVEANRFQSPDQSTTNTCQGDSGGPVMAITQGSRAERVVGVTSFGFSGCVSSSTYMRADTHREWVDATSALWEQAPTCQADGACVSTCSGGGDPDCVPFLGRCHADAYCLSGVCARDPQSPSFYCTRSCAGPADCGAGLACVDGLCAPARRPEADVGQACTEGVTFCRGEGGACSGPLGSPATCQISCVVSADCPFPRQVCTPGNNGYRFCQDPPRVLASPQPAVIGDYAGGCAATLGGPSGPALIAALGLLARRRGRRRASPPAPM